MNSAVAKRRRLFREDLSCYPPRWWNPKDSRVRRIRNYVVAIMAVGVGSLFAMTAIYR
jgi:hypothetical protein